MNTPNGRVREAPYVYRMISFELACFDRLKEEQRRLQQQFGRTVTNSEALCSLIKRAPRWD
ncbi:hypothetical protein [Agrilutibacter solisilvae]|uniref:Uncharacterized protein n=1 Tax=Agrilutibacter solisilvae TaxID=2763317 RepID=A0A974XYH2_9GAMM|nr:hypothetical protein [Lysobacter solisilvae]QSX78117.1 hypothetical protein I8J32_015680 [Lysobacter solisilvae]